MKCDLCDHEASGENFDEWMNALKPHYAEMHKDFMEEKGKLSPEDQMKEMNAWMEENKKRFEDA